jgi:CheY-like chemotaxis protein/predicted regulator of Ras-like GTPase activity (Roadblock/LC7/MglB family)
MPTVLVVDENLSICKAVERALVPHGIGVLPMTSAREALAFAEVEIPDVIICHIESLSFEPFDFCAAARRLPGMSETPILGLASRGWPDLRWSAEAAGVVTVLPRPFDGRDLAATVNRLLERSSVPAVILGAPALQEPLAELRRLEGFRSALLVSSSGLVREVIGNRAVARAVSGGELEGLFRAAGQAMAGAGLGELTGTILEGSHGVILARQVNSDSMLIVVVSGSAPLGPVRFHFERARRAIQQNLAPHSTT